MVASEYCLLMEATWDERHTMSLLTRWHWPGTLVIKSDASPLCVCWGHALHG